MNFTIGYRYDFLSDFQNVLKEFTRVRSFAVLEHRYLNARIIRDHHIVTNICLAESTYPAI